MFDRCDELLGRGYYRARGLSSYLVTTPHSSQNTQLSAEKLMNTGPGLLSAKVSGVIGPLVINTNDSNPGSRVLAAAKISRRRSHKFLPQYKRLNRE